ncbi:MAG: hypothetical protein K2N23_01505 [Clostridia bacterium]|nr:hypothetical protein [Clostridia bacterium]
MPNILTPSNIWNDFDETLDVSAVTIGIKRRHGIKFERVNFLGRETGEGRVKGFGIFASSETAPAKETVIIFPDSSDTVDENVLRLFVERGYSAFMVDYRGKWENEEHYTVYPSNIDYANTVKCGRYKEFVDESADKTSWYEWVAVGIYARKYVAERTGSENIAVLGIRDGGEIAWKLAAAAKFACAIPVCAVGWLAYLGVSKYRTDEQQLDTERYRFIAGIDSQAYAPFVRCPMLLLCSTNDVRFDYDRAYDTFSRINPEFANDSIITYSVQCDAAIDGKSFDDMIMFLGKHLKGRQVFLPQSGDITVSVDEEQNLTATAKFDDSGDIEECGIYMAEDAIDSSIREWILCEDTQKISKSEFKTFLNVYKDTATLFVLAYAKYANGFTVWSKTAVKKLSGRFKNTCDKCNVMFSAKNGTDGFCISDTRSVAVGGIFFTGSVALPQIVTKAKGIDGIYSEHGLTTYRLNSARYAPTRDKVLKIDVFCDKTAEIVFMLEDTVDGETYRYGQSVIGGVWQSLVIKSKLFKNVNGVPLTDYSHNARLCIDCEEKYAINNVMWL